MEQESAFNEMKHRLTIAPVLAYPDFSADAGLFVVDTEASQPLGIGAVLSRLQLSYYLVGQKIAPED